MKKLLILFFLIFAFRAEAAAPSRAVTYISGTTIQAADVTGNEDQIFNYLQSGVDTYFDDTIVNADIKSNAGIISSKLDLTEISQDFKIVSGGSFENDGTSVFDGTVDLNAKLTADSSEIEGSNFDINGGTIDGITSLTSSGNLDIGSYSFRAQTLISDVATGTSPLTVTSTTKVSNLNADTVDGYSTATTATANSIPVLGADTYLADATVDTTALKTTSGAVSREGERALLTLPGGAYGFYPQIKVSADGTATYEAEIFNVTVLSGYTSYTTTITLTAPPNKTIYAQQTYVTASGQDMWVFLLVDKVTGDIESAYAAPDHPMYGNGGDITKVPHPFIGNDLTGKEVVILSKDEVEDLKKKTTREKDLLTVINEEYGKVDMTKEENYVPLHTGEFIDTAPVKIDKLPSEVKVRKLKRR